MSMANKKILKFINEGRSQNGFSTFKSLGQFERFRGKQLTHDERANLLESCKGMERLCKDYLATQKGKSLKDLGVSSAKCVPEQDTHGSEKTPRDADHAVVKDFLKKD